MTVRPNEEVRQVNRQADPLSAGARDIRRAAQILASRVPGRLAPLAEVAYNFSWTWRSDEIGRASCRERV